MMKTKILTSLLLILAFAGCKKEIKIQSENVQATNNTSQCEISTSRPVFSSEDATANTSCIKFNEHILAIVIGLQDSLIAQAKADYASLQAMGDSMIGPYQLIVKDSVFQMDQNYISVRLLTYTFAGGAHGMTNFHGLNYDVKNQKILTNQEILDYSKTSEINDLLKAYLENPENCFTDAPTLENLSTLNFSATSVIFTYEQYILGPYSCGYATIAVPREKMKDLLLIK